MPLPKSLKVYEDVRLLFEQALNSPKGVEIQYEAIEVAIRERSRFNYFRQLDRAANLEIYPAGHALHGCSPYDPFVLRIRGTTLCIEPRFVGELKITEIT